MRRLLLGPLPGPLRRRRRSSSRSSARTTSSRPRDAPGSADTIAPPRRRPGGPLARRRAIPNDTPLTYAASGVDIDAKMAAVARAKEAIRSTFTAGVVGDVGGFGGLFRPDFAGMEDPLLVASADGVGTKIKVAIAAGVHDTVGQDIVNHCVNDILVQGARPLFFLDYVGDRDGCDREVVARGHRRRRASPAARTAAPSSAARRPRCPGSTPTATTTSPGRSSASSTGRSSSTARASPRATSSSASPPPGLHTNGYSLARKLFFERLGLAPARRAFPSSGRPSPRRSWRSTGAT